MLGFFLSLSLSPVPLFPSSRVLLLCSCAGGQCLSASPGSTPVPRTGLWSWELAGSSDGNVMADICEVDAHISKRYDVKKRLGKGVWPTNSFRQFSQTKPTLEQHTTVYCYSYAFSLIPSGAFLWPIKRSSWKKLSCHWNFVSCIYVTIFIGF